MNVAILNTWIKVINKIYKSKMFGLAVVFVSIMSISTFSNADTLYLTFSGNNVSGNFDGSNHFSGASWIIEYAIDDTVVDATMDSGSSPYYQNQGSFRNSIIGGALFLDVNDGSGGTLYIMDGDSSTGHVHFNNTGIHNNLSINPTSSGYLQFITGGGGVFPTLFADQNYLNSAVLGTSITDDSTDPWNNRSYLNYQLRRDFDGSVSGGVITTSGVIISLFEAGVPAASKFTVSVSDQASILVPVNPDTDEDGLFDDEDNCPEIANEDQADFDVDGLGDVCDDDDDNDSVIDIEDNCPKIVNEDQTDFDADGFGDICDDDDDNDSVADKNDECTALVSDFELVNENGCSMNNVLNDLRVLTLEGKNTKELEKAISSLEAALDPANWENGNLILSEGKKAFKEIKDAVKHLLKIKSIDVSSEINVILDIALYLAKTSLEEAKAADCSAKEIKKAEKELEKAEKNITKGKIDHAIHHLSKTWEKSQKALNH